VIFKHAAIFSASSMVPNRAFPSAKERNGMTKIAILGAGGWGTALAIVLSRGRKPHEVSLWVHNAERARSMQRERETKSISQVLNCRGHSNSRRIGSCAFWSSGHCWRSAIRGCARGLRFRAAFVAPSASFVSASKGLEPATHLRMSEVIAQVVTPKFAPRIAVISGPSFALEAARGEPHGGRSSFARCRASYRAAGRVAGPNFRLYTNDDVLGVELAGAMKNVMAIAAGACQGLGLGSNALAALITRGLTEMTRLAVALGRGRRR